MVKLSKYNFLRNYGGMNVFFNAYTCALAVVDSNFMKVISDVESDNYDETKYDKKLIDDMKMSGCLVEDDVDELELLSLYRNMGKYNTNSLGLTLAPTMACNFRCQYCFEEHTGGTMSDVTQEHLIEFISRHLNGIKDLAVTWYGGEPLLAKSVLYNLSEKILLICNENNINYEAFIITNASLMDDSDIEKFRKYHIHGAQITIDGPKDVHDKRRKSCNGESTYDKLVSNVNKLLNAGFRVILRVNIDKENINDVDELIADLKKKISRYAEINVDFGKVSVFSEVCKSIESDCFDNKEYGDIILPLYEKIEKAGFTVNKMLAYPHIKLNYCCADYVNSYVIDSDGLIYKCWNHVGVPSENCGKVPELELKSNYLKWVRWNPLLQSKCKECNVLPICMGGCPSSAFDENNDQPVCDVIKYNLDKVLRTYYEKLKGDVGL